MLVLFQRTHMGRREEERKTKAASVALDNAQTQLDHATEKLREATAKLDSALERQAIRLYRARNGLTVVAMSGTTGQDRAGKRECRAGRDRHEHAGVYVVVTL
jgi:hypothetical protein